jgi:hypothetical protein
VTDERPPALDPDAVREFVVAGHGDLDGVKAALGMEGVVRAVLAADPAARDAPGPHGIPLVEHARAGGADKVVALLEAS